MYFRYCVKFCQFFVFLGVGVTLILNTYSDSREENMGSPVFFLAAYKVVINAALAYGRGGVPLLKFTCVYIYID